MKIKLIILFLFINSYCIAKSNGLDTMMYYRIQKNRLAVTAINNTMTDLLMKSDSVKYSSKVDLSYTFEDLFFFDDLSVMYIYIKEFIVYFSVWYNKEGDLNYAVEYVRRK